MSGTLVLRPVTGRGTHARSRRLCPLIGMIGDPSRVSPLPAGVADDTPCSCEPGEPCTEGGPPYPWMHQIEAIEISTTDAVTDPPPCRPLCPL